MTFTQSIRTCFSKFATFSGRARRAEFWYFALFSILGGLFFGILDTILFGSDWEDPEIFGAIFGLILFVPSLSVAVRRLHDIGRTGWWWWFWLIPIVGWIILIVFHATQGDDGENEYGADPINDQNVQASSIPPVGRD